MDTAKAGAKQVAVNGAMQAAQPEVTQTTPGQGIDVANMPPDSVFRIIEELQRRSAMGTA